MNFKKEEYTNRHLADILDAMMNAVAEFDHRKRGPAFRAVLFTLADVFQEDRPTMYRHFGSQASKREKVPSGGAKIMRHRDQVAAKSGKPRKATKGCASCPDQAGIHTGQAGAQRADQMKGTRTKTTTTVAFTDVDDLRAKFEDNITAMRAYAQSRDIKISAAITKPATMARVLFEKLTEQNEEEE